MPITNEFTCNVTQEPIAIQAVVAAKLEEAKNYLERIAHSGAMSGLHLETEVVPGLPAASILSVANSHNIDLIVLCSHGYSGMTRWIMGSVAEKASRYAPIPVLVLREDVPALASPSPNGGPLRAFIPLDGSARARTAIAPAGQLIAALAAPGPGALHLLRVMVLPHTGLSSNERAAILQEAKQQLSSTAEEIRQGHIASSLAGLQLSIIWFVTFDDDVAAGIVRVAESGEDVEGVGVPGRSNMIAMATHGYTGFQRWTLDSITERVLHATWLPLLIIRPSDLVSMEEQAQAVTTER